MPGSTSSSYFRVGDNIELWRVVVYLSVLIIIVMVLEQIMHKAEHSLQKYPKYHEMLTKIYRELMILGLLGLGIKVVKELGVVDGYGKNIMAFQVADLIVFISAFALIIQAIAVFSLMRNKNMRLDRDELVSSADLIELVTRHQTMMRRQSAFRRMLPWGLSVTIGGSKIRFTTARFEEVVTTRTLRHFFLRKYGLPELFPFSKYLRQAQDNQITHMIDIEMSMWVLLIFLTWLLDVSTVLLEDIDHLVERHALVAMFLIFAWALTLFHIVVAWYLRSALKRILEAAGYSSHNDMLTCLQMVAAEEAYNLENQKPDQALEMMHQVQEQQEAKQHLKHGGGGHGHGEKGHGGDGGHGGGGGHDGDGHGGGHGGGHEGHGEGNCLSHDTGFQVLAMFLRGMCGKKHHAHEDDDDDEYARGEGAPARVPKVKIRFFNRLAMHFVVKFLIMLNGFYFAFMCQAVLYEMPEIYENFGFAAVVMVPMPLLLNMFVFQPQICRNFVNVSCVFKVDVPTLSEVITHFSECVELRADFVACLKQSMRDNNQTMEELHESLLAKDPARTGFIELEELRQVLRAFGCQISFFRFNGIAKLLFRLKGTHAEYTQIERLLTLAEQEDLGSSSIYVAGGDARATAAGNQYPRYLHTIMAEETEVQRRMSTRFSDDVVVLESSTFQPSKKKASSHFGLPRVSLNMRRGPRRPLEPVQGESTRSATDSVRGGDYRQGKGGDDDAVFL